MLPCFRSLAADGPLLAGGGVMVLMYHKIARAPVATNLPFLYVTPRGFDRQMGELLGAGFANLPFREAPDTAEVGRTGFCVTFDDGFRNASDHALPVLRARGLRATMFLVADRLGGTDEWDRAIGEPPLPLMDEAEVRDWLAAGQSIGAHTLTHPRLTRLTPERMRAEIFDSRRKLEDRFGVPVRHFCYPYGDQDERVRALVAEAGYEAACTVEHGVNGPGVPPLSLRRVLVCDAGRDPLAPLRRARRVLGSVRARLKR